MHNILLYNFRRYNLLRCSFSISFPIIFYEFDALISSYAIEMVYFIRFQERIPQKID